ncbi:DNA binding protein [Gordonia phage Frokostdame]|uniref:Uncharacterized protein n=1 Tax=Gordonia phage Frokostdame TaxID=2250320 RepID=A0A345L368_9CAUD|nr:DNA binding protein [Gordonia phage Frokostdame]AXH49720.1 hypothetical protein SEA_FROKOSTDAME_78 [Gordonia phage Frokostdame]
MTRRDIVDDIDALIDEQLAAGEDGQARRAATAERRCGHCGRAWHGLAITARMEEMHREYLTNVVMARMAGEEYEYAESAILGDYRYADDDSTVLCPGSEFIGPLPSTCDAAASLTDDDGCQCHNCMMWRAAFGANAIPNPAIPNPLDAAIWSTPDLGSWRDPARWWRLDAAPYRHRNLRFDLVEDFRPGRQVLLMRIDSGVDEFQGASTLEATRHPEHVYAATNYMIEILVSLDVHGRRPDDLGGRIVWHEIDGPGGDYVHSRALISSSRVDRWFDDHGLWFLAPRELRAVRRRLMGSALDDGGPVRPGRTRTIPDGAPYLPADVVLQRGDTVGYEIGGRVYTGYVTDFEPGPRGDDTVLRLDGSRTEEFAITLNDPDPSIRRLFGLASDGGL